MLTTTATVTTNGPGRLAPHSTLTVGGVTIPIPERIPNPVGDGTSTVAIWRIAAALKELGYKLAPGFRDQMLTGDRGMSFLVTPL